MNISLTLDYEVFFGSGSGNARRSVVEPTEALCETVRRHGLSMVFFVDALWLIRLREEAYRHASARQDLEATMRQLDSLVRAGHELQLHLHPHWLDSSHGRDGWELDLRRYRLHDFSDESIASMVREGTQVLRAFGPRGGVSAFRAGGWCIQPFERLREPLLAAGIKVDSTVYNGGHQHALDRSFDFRRAPAASSWRFDRDPLIPVEGGPFLEVPIASHSVWPGFYWRLALERKRRRPEHVALGEGQAMPLSRADLLARLLAPSRSVVSIDGLKADFLEAAWRSYRQRGMEDFVVIGHPKALTRHSLRRLDEFLTRHRDQRWVGMANYAERLAPRPAASPSLQLKPGWAI
jgi:hypothetical protein